MQGRGEGKQGPFCWAFLTTRGHVLESYHPPRPATHVTQEGNETQSLLKVKELRTRSRWLVEFSPPLSTVREAGGQSAPAPRSRFKAQVGEVGSLERKVQRGKNTAQVLEQVLEPRQGAAAQISDLSQD